MGKVSSYKTGDIAQDIYERVKIQIPGIYILHQPKRKSPWYIQIKRDLPAGVKKNHFYRTVDEAIEAYNRFADTVVRQEAEFLLTPTERQAIRLWRRHREKRMLEGKNSQTLEEAIRYAMDAEHKQDLARRTIEELFHEYSLYKEKEAETKKGDTAVKQCRRNLADTKRMLDLFDAIYIDELGSVPGSPSAATIRILAVITAMHCASGLCKTAEDRRLISNFHYLLLRGSENVSESGTKRLAQLLLSNRKISDGYVLNFYQRI